MHLGVGCLLVLRFLLEWIVKRDFVERSDKRDFAEIRRETREERWEIPGKRDEVRDLREERRERSGIV